MKKRILLIIFIAFTLIVIALIHILNTTNQESKNELKEKGDSLFGYDYCTTNHSLEGGGDALTKWECKLCGYTDINPDTNIPEICYDCSKKTDRCYKCGKLK